MYELIQAKGSSYYIESPAKVGLVRLNDTGVCLIDSGSDKDSAIIGPDMSWASPTLIEGSKAKEIGTDITTNTAVK